MSQPAPYGDWPDPQQQPQADRPPSEVPTHLAYPPNPSSWPDPSSAPGYPPQNPAPPPHPAPPAYPGGAPPGYGYGGYPPPGYPAPGYLAPGYPPPPKTNGAAVGAMVTSLVSLAALVCVFCFAPLGILALGGGVTGTILGFVARRQIRERGEQGDGMALTGVIVGLITTALGVLALIVTVVWIGWALSYDSSSFS